MPTAQKQTFHLFETMFQAIYPYTCIESQYTSLTVDTQYQKLDHSPSQHQNFPMIRAGKASLRHSFRRVL